MNNNAEKDHKSGSLALGLDNRFNRKPRWMSGMAVYLLQSETARHHKQNAKKIERHGRRPHHRAA